MGPEWPKSLKYQCLKGKCSRPECSWRLYKLDMAALQHARVGGWSILQKRQSDRNEVTQEAHVPVQDYVYWIRVSPSRVWSSECPANTGMGLSPGFFGKQEPLVTLYHLSTLIPLHLHPKGYSHPLLRPAPSVSGVLQLEPGSETPLFT